MEQKRCRETTAPGRGKTAWAGVKETAGELQKGETAFSMGPACQRPSFSYSNLRPSSFAEARNFNIEVLILMISAHR